MNTTFSVCKAAVVTAAVCAWAGGDAARAQGNPPSNASGTTTAAATPAQESSLPYGAGEVLKMQRAGLNKEVIVGYINNARMMNHLSADNIIYLRSLGIPQEIINAMIQRDGQLQQEAARLQMPGANGTVAAQSSGQIAVPATPAPDTTVVAPEYPVYSYDYPYPYYNYNYYWPPVVIGGGWWWGWHGGYGGFHGEGAIRPGFAGGGFHGGSVGGFHGGGGHGGGHR